MSTRAPGRGSRRGRRATLAALGVLVAGSLAACGSKDFPNDPRPPAPIEVSAKVDSKKVVVSPDRFGAGLVTFTVANLSNSPVRFTIDGTSKKVSTSEIQPGTPATPHRLTREEVFVILDGSARVRIDGDSATAEAGDVVVVPAAVDFEIVAGGTQPLRALCCLPVGGQALLADGDPFTPPWAQ